MWRAVKFKTADCLSMLVSVKKERRPNKVFYESDNVGFSKLFIKRLL